MADSNSEKIDEVVDPVALKQLQDLTKGVKDVEKAFVDSIKAAIQFNAITGNSNPATFSKSAAESTKALKTIGDNYEKQRLAEIKLQQAREKAFDDYEKKLQRQQQIADKAAQQEQERIAKIAQAQAEAAKRASVIGPTIIGGQGDSKELTIAQAEAIGAKTRALQDQTVAAITAVTATQQLATADKATTTAVREETVALTEQQKILNSTIGTIDQNVAREVQLKTELQQVQGQLKTLAASANPASQAVTNLTAKELELKNAISANALVLRQQAKEGIAAATSQDQMRARLAQLRTAYDSLTESERKNSQIGGVLLRDITELRKKTEEINKSQGKYNDSVGDYERKIKSAIASYLPFGRQIVGSIDALKKAASAGDEASGGISKLGLTFAGFTITTFALAIASAIYYLDQFQGHADKIDIRLAGLKGRFGAVGESIVNAFTSSGGDGKKAELNEFEKYLLSLQKTMLSIQTLGGTNILGKAVSSTDQVAKAAEDAERLKKAYEDLSVISEINVKKLQGQANQFRAQGRNQALTTEERIALLEKAEAKEKEVIEIQQKRGDVAVDVGVRVGNIYNKLTKDQIDRLEQGDIKLATSLFRQSKITKDGYELYKQGLTQRIDGLNQANLLAERIQNDHDRLQVKTDKKDAEEQLKIARQLAADKLADAKVTLESERLNAKLIYEDENQSYKARFAALAIFKNRSKSLINNERDAANLVPGISDLRKGTNQKVANNQNKQVDLDAIKESAIIQKQVNDKVTADLKAALDIRRSAEKQLEYDFVNEQNDRLTVIEVTRAKESQLLAEKYSTGKISTKKYNEEIYEIENDASERNIQVQIDAIKKIADAQAAALALGFGDAKDLQSTVDKYTKLELAASDLKTKKILKNAETVQKANEERSELEKKLVTESVDFAVDLIDKQFQKQIDNINELKKAVEDQSKAEVDAVNRSLDTQQNKAQKIAIINAQAAAQQAQLDKKAAEIKTKQAKFDRAISIARIIDNTAEADIRAFKDFPFPIALGIAGLITAIGAVQLANVLSTPLPKYEKGGITGGGKLIWGEKGTELAIEPSGKSYLSPSVATIAEMPKGTRIIPHDKLVRAERLNNYVGGQEVPWQEVLSELRLNRPKEAKKGPTYARGWMKEMKSASEYSRYAQNHFR